MSTTLVPRKLNAKRKPVQAVEPVEQFDDEQSAMTPLVAIAGSIVEIDLKDIVVHKHNRTITDESVEGLADSIKTVGQTDAATVRRVNGKYELLSGERRYRACKLAKIKTLKCIIVEETQEQALIRLAAANSNRENLNAIERAKLMVQLMKPSKDGGSGLSRIDAGKAVGLMSESGAKNALRFLKLPEGLQAMIVSGKLSERAARRLIPFAELTAVMDDVVKELSDEYRSVEFQVDLMDDNVFPWGLKNLIEENTRPMDKRSFGSNKLIKNRWTDYPKLFDGDGGLFVREIQVGKDTWLVTSDTKGWDALQAPLAEKRFNAKDKGPGASKAKETGKKPTSAELAKEQAAKRKAANDRLTMWTNGIWGPAALRLHLTVMCGTEDGKLLLPFLIGSYRGHFQEMLDASYLECDMAVSKGDSCPLIGGDSDSLNSTLWRLLLWPVSSRFETKGIKDRMARQPIVVPMGCVPDLDRLSSTFCRSCVLKLAQRCKVTIEMFWEAARTNRPSRDLLQVWIDRHTTDQLKDLWTELKLKGDAPAKHDDIVAAIMRIISGSDKLPMPKLLARMVVK